MTDAPKTISLFRRVGAQEWHLGLLGETMSHGNIAGEEYFLSAIAEAEKREAVNAALERASASAEQWLKADELLLRTGEMNAGELQVAKAVAGGIVRAIRAMKEEQ